MEDTVNLVLYVDGSSARSLNAQENLEYLCKMHLHEYAISVVDVRADPQVAVSQQLVALPTLVIDRQGRRQRIIGDLSIADAIITAIGMSEQARRMRQESVSMMARAQELASRNRNRNRLSFGPEQRMPDPPDSA